MSSSSLPLSTRVISEREREQDRFQSFFDSSTDESMNFTPPPIYSISEQPVSKLPTYLASILQPELRPDGSPLSCKSYAILPYDLSSVIITSPHQILQPDPHLIQSVKFAIRIHSDSIYLFKASNQIHQTIFGGKPIMEATLNGFFRKQSATLDDWRQCRKTHKGSYKLKYKSGVHTYNSHPNDLKAWKEDSEGCLNLINLNSNRQDHLARLKPTSVSTQSNAKKYNSICNHPYYFQPLPRGSKSPFYNLMGRLDLLDGNLTHGLEEELAILTCVATYIIHRRCSLN